jgi:hypothetical protein
MVGFFCVSEKKAFRFNPPRRTEGGAKADQKWSAFFVCLKKGFQVQSAAAD